MESARQDYNDRIWETIKLFFTVWPIVSILLSVIASYPFQSGTERSPELQQWQQIVLIMISLLMLSFSFILQRNVKRERRHIIALEVIMRRIEYYLGLMEKDSPIRVNEGWIKQYEEINDKGEERFIHDQTRIHWEDWKNFLKTKRTGHSIFFALFFICGLISEALAGYFIYKFSGSCGVLFCTLAFLLLDLWWLKNA